MSTTDPAFTIPPRRPTWPPGTPASVTMVTDSQMSPPVSFLSYVGFVHIKGRGRDGTSRAPGDSNQYYGPLTSNGHLMTLYFVTLLFDIFQNIKSIH